MTDTETDISPDATALYPCGIGLYCDLCATEVRGDFAVNDLTTKAERFAIARRHFSDADGWTCTDDADLCPGCAPTAVFLTATGRVYHRASSCHVFRTGQALADVDCGCDDFCSHRLPVKQPLNVMTIRDAAGHGLTPCKVCRPPLAPADHFGHQPILSFIDGRALGRVCARCTSPHPYGVNAPSAARWPCTTARILGLPVNTAPAEEQCDRCHQHRPHVAPFDTLDGRTLRLCVRCWSECQYLRSTGHYIDAAEAISEASDEELVTALVTPIRPTEDSP